jgi:hypothetical protein
MPQNNETEPLMGYTISADDAMAAGPGRNVILSLACDGDHLEGRPSVASYGPSYIHLERELSQLGWRLRAGEFAITLCPDCTRKGPRPAAAPKSVEDLPLFAGLPK